MQAEKHTTDTEQIHALMRHPDEVMTLARMGSAHPMRLSFLRQLMRRIKAENWTFTRALWQVDAAGVGRAVYRAQGPERTYSLVVFAHDLPAAMRTDRVIATAWDATFTLFDGIPDTADLARLEANVPLQEAGRVSATELTLGRANRSVRLFEHVVQHLAEGRQPDQEQLARIGYLMRTSAIYGSGKFGAADRLRVADRPEFAAPFQAEMLSVWLIREFTFDIVEHMARVRGGQRAIGLAPALRRYLGVGNSTGLGMVPFLIHHPLLLNNWIHARETALARVRLMAEANADTMAAFAEALANARQNADAWYSEHPLQVEKLSQLRTDLARIAQLFAAEKGKPADLWDRLWRRGQHELGMEGQEALLALLLEPHAELVDDLGATMSADTRTLQTLDGSQSVGDVLQQLETNYAWALAYDFSHADNQARFWYVSAEKMEPRLGDRAQDAGAELEQPLCIARLASEYHQALQAAPASQLLAEFLLHHPEQRFMARRLAMTRTAPYGEIRHNLIAADVLPIDMMRCKLAFFGASHFDPRSDRWVRISLFHGEPSPPGLEKEMPS